jgi:enamine deaminase RidA (YjgF/YER057c/UK114 family)
MHNTPIYFSSLKHIQVKVFGSKGMHARSAVGTNSLPLGVAVEVEGIFEIEESAEEKE